MFSRTARNCKIPKLDETGLRQFGRLQWKAREMAFDTNRFLSQGGVGRTVMVYLAGTIIFRQGDPADRIYYLQQGSAKETVTAGARGAISKEAVTGMLGSGVFFGTGALSAGQLRTSTVTTVTQCQATVFVREVIDSALNEPVFARLFTAHLLDRNSLVEAEKVDLLMNSREKRLAQKLLQLSHADTGQPQRIGPEITQEMLAEMIGTTRPRVNFFMNKFRRLGYIQYSDGITVLPTLVKVLAAEGGLDD
jgi:CRP-like cAMP-binding protein